MRPERIAEGHPLPIPNLQADQLFLHEGATPLRLPIEPKAVRLLLLEVLCLEQKPVRWLLSADLLLCSTPPLQVCWSAKNVLVTLIGAHQKDQIDRGAFPPKVKSTPLLKHRLLPPTRHLGGQHAMLCGAGQFDLLLTRGQQV